jgi:hypothetical protein
VGRGTRSDIAMSDEHNVEIAIIVVNIAVSKQTTQPMLNRDDIA